MLFLKVLLIEKFYGVGKKIVFRMYELGIYIGKDLYECIEMMLIWNFGKMGYFFYCKVRGIYDFLVNVIREWKFVGKEYMYG